MLKSDSEDDGDYVPPANGAESSSSDSDNESEPLTKRVKTGSPEATEDVEAKKRVREELWKSFQESVNSEGSTSMAQTPKMVKIEKRYRFAGEVVIEVVEMPEDSPDTKKWPLWMPPNESAPASNPGSSALSSTSANPSPPTVISSSSTVTSSTIPILNSPPQSTTTLANATKPPPTKHPGPRKSKVTLSSLPSSSSKPKTLTTLQKSAMDWQAHLSSADELTKNELEANRRGGGFLEKKEFLERVGERKEGVLEGVLEGRKRRR